MLEEQTPTKAQRLHDYIVAMIRTGKYTTGDYTLRREQLVEEAMELDKLLQEKTNEKT